VALEVDDPELLPLAVAAGLGVGVAAAALVAGKVIPGVVARPLDDARAAIPLVAVAAREGASAQAEEFLHLVQNLYHGRLLHSATVDLTNPPEDVPMLVGPAPRVLQPAV
jgi:DNA-binding transcriptional LysR family regulator